MWAVLTRSRPDKDVMIIPDTPSFYRDPAQGSLGPDGHRRDRAVRAGARFERKRMPGADTVDLAKYFPDL